MLPVAGSMKEIKLRIKSVESTMQITKAMELVASSKLRRAKERVENSRPYFETLYATLFDIAAADSEFSSPYLAKCEKKCCLYIVIAGDRGLPGGYNSNILKAVEADAEGREYCVLPIGKKAVEYFERHKIRILTSQGIFRSAIALKFPALCARSFWKALLMKFALPLPSLFPC